MEIELPPEISRDLIKALVEKYLPFAPKKVFRARPFEWLFFNAFTQTLRDMIYEQSENGIANSKLQKEHQHIKSLLSMIAMMLKQLTEDGTVTFKRDVDGSWYDDNDIHVMICHPDDDTMTLQLVVGGSECSETEE